MAKLYFYYSAMNAGKTTTLLQSAYNYHERGMRTLILTPALDDRGALGVRLGEPLGRPCLLLEGLAGELARLLVVEAVGERDAVLPAERVEAADVEQLARRAVGLRGVEAQHGVGVHHAADQLRQGADRQVAAGADVDVAYAVIALHQEYASVGKVIDMQELAPRRAGAPHDDFAIAAQLCLVHLPEQCRQHVRTDQVEIITRTV